MLWIVALSAWVLTEAILMCIVIVAGRADDRMERWTSTPEAHDSPPTLLLIRPVAVYHSLSRNKSECAW